MSTDAQKTLAGLGRMGNRFEDAMFDAVSDILTSVQYEAQDLAPVGDYPLRSSSPAMQLRESITIVGPTGRSGVYGGSVGPTVVYGAQREWGGWITANTTKGMWFWWAPEDKHILFRKIMKVYQDEYPSGRYLSPASRTVNETEVEATVTMMLTEAVEGG